MSTDGAMPDQYPGAVTGAPEGPAGAEPEAVFLRVRTEVLRVVVGREEPLEQLLIAVLCRGHALLEDVPGVGKTLLARSLAAAMGCGFRRIQFTPDVMPSDVTGSSVFNQRSADFEFRPGPIFTQVLLADEINRATPRAQSALLEAMEERQVTVDGQTRPLPEPFLVLATQNPIELEGHRSRCPRPSSTASWCACRRVTRRSTRSTRCCAASNTTTRWLGSGRSRRRPRSSRSRSAGERCGRRRRPWLPARDRPRHPDRRPGRSRCEPAGRPRPPPRRTGAGAAARADPSPCPTTSRRWPRPVLAHRILLTARGPTPR